MKFIDIARLHQELFFLTTVMLWGSWLSAVYGNVRLPHLFGDHMVLQRDQNLHFWGWADPGEEVTIFFAGQAESVFADSHGQWSLQLDPVSAGGPHTLTVTGKNKIELKDILIGDVWIASGQSNMQWQIRQTPYNETDTNWIKQSSVRLFTVQIASDYMPRDDVQGGIWQELNQENIAGFSAVAYHFAKFISQQIQVPIGMVNSSLGATTIETWMSNETLATFDQFKPEILPVIERGQSFSELEKEFTRRKDEWQAKAYLTGPGMDEKWYLPETDISEWQEITVPGFWEDQGLPDHDGAVWYRKEFDMPAGAEAHDSILMQLSQIDDYDITWVNGVKIGETYGRHNHRNYWIARNLLQEKKNVIVIRIFDIGHKGGFSTHPFWIHELMRGTWLMRPGLKIQADNFKTLPTVNSTPFSSPGVLFNANIAPLTRMPVKGLIWYQGESNDQRAEEYRDLFKALITDWRHHWQAPKLPFLFVQLANYKQESHVPGDSEWAELRESQAAALELNHTGMAVTIDIGEADDIHPGNKLEVGRRLSLLARRIAYDEMVISQGPVSGKVEFKKDLVMVTYLSEGGHPVTNDKFGYIRGFELAGKDQEFYWAKAELQGTQVRVYADQVKRPVAIRYLWSDNPGQINLYNQEGLPALPFRSDQWPGLTAGKKFDHQIARF